MLIRKGPFLIVVALCCASAAADQTYTFHEALQPGQTFAIDITSDGHDKTAIGPKDKLDHTDIRSRTSLKITETVLEAKDGSSVKTRVKVGPDSTNTMHPADADETKTPFAYAGKTVTLTREADGSVSLQLHRGLFSFAASQPASDANPGDTEMLKDLLNPDADFYPDHPVAVGETWAVSEKLGARAGLGKKDTLKARCRLDSVKTVDGKQMAQIAVSTTTVAHQEGNVEIDSDDRTTLTVDIAAGMIVEFDQKGTSTTKTPPDEAIQQSGTGEYGYHAKVLKSLDPPASEPAAKP